MSQLGHGDNAFDVFEGNGSASLGGGDGAKEGKGEGKGMVLTHDERVDFLFFVTGDKNR